MKRTRIICLIIVFMFMIMGVGYAYWSEIITVNGTVSTGELLVEFQGYDDYIDVPRPYIIYNGRSKYYDNSRVAPFTLEDNNHKLVANFIDVFPGMFYSIPFKAVNNGTMPAVFNRATITYDINDSTLKPGENEQELINTLGNNLKINDVSVKIFNRNGVKLYEVHPYYDDYIDLDNFEYELNTNILKGVSLESGQYLEITGGQGGNIANKLGGQMEFYFSTDFGNEFEEKQFTVSIQIDWRQFNAPAQ